MPVPVGFRVPAAFARRRRRLRRVGLDRHRLVGEVALAADRIQRATTLEVKHIRQKWAGLRSFVADRSLVLGMDGQCPGFFWLAGQGGFGIMTSPAAARAAACLIVDGALPSDLAELGLTPEVLSPERPGLKRA